jgi:uncharacterized membrane protein
MIGTPDLHAARVGATERTISLVLRLGVLASLVCLIVGTALNLSQRGPGFLTDRAALGALVAPSEVVEPTWVGFRDGLLAWRGDAIVTLGLLLLILTPVVRVAVSIRAFAVEHDRVYVAITATVLVLLLTSFAMGAVG